MDFFVMKNLYRMDEAAENVSSGTEMSLSDQHFSYPRTVLLVDDDDIVRKAASRILEKMGYAVIDAENGMVALEMYKANQDRISFVVLDIIMPVLNGRETLAQMKQINPNVKTLLISAYTRDQKIDDLIQDGSTEFMSKPFDLESLAMGISRLNP
jgi:CheY-like chemotaxis protein